MRLVVDALAVRPGSASIVIGNLLAGWSRAFPGDEIVVLGDDRLELPLPGKVARQTIVARDAPLPARLRARSLGVRRACRILRADALLGAVTASVLAGAQCPYGVIVYDLRHELRPAQFSLKRRILRRMLYGWSFHRAGALFCISERTRRDLLARRPRLAGKAHVALLGADHAAAWRADEDQQRAYALAFGHFANKNAELVLEAWRAYRAAERSEVVLRVCGLSGDARAAAEQRVVKLGISDSVELLPWLSDRDFEALFAGAAAVLLPSDFEGFGLPAVEALALGVPVVISTDEALLEVTGGHGAVWEGDGAAGLARAIGAALASPPGRRAAGVAHAREFTWERTARDVRAVLQDLVQPQSPDSSR
jgi:glycosyltransferase involved in cell wall biosynthesis